MSTVQESLFLGPELAGSLMTPAEFDAAEVGDELYAKLVVREGEVYMPPLLPGFELPVSRLLAEADMLEQAELNDPES